MTQPNTVLSPRSFRKALLAQRGVTTATVAPVVPCSEEMVRKVFNREFKYREADKVKAIMRIAAEQARMSVEELWPLNEAVEPGSDQAADETPTLTEDAGAAGDSDR